MKTSDERIYSDASNSLTIADPHEKASLEKQMTLYDEYSQFDNYDYGLQVRKIDDKCLNQNCYERENISYDSIEEYIYQDECYVSNNEDRQWDSGGNFYSVHYNQNKGFRKNLPDRSFFRTNNDLFNYGPTFTSQCDYKAHECDDSGIIADKRKFLQPQKNVSTYLERSGKKLPPTPIKPSNVILGKKYISHLPTSGRQLPQPINFLPKTSCNKSNYKKNYNYAYHSQDNSQLKVSSNNKESFSQIHIIDDIPHDECNIIDGSEMSHNEYDRNLVAPQHSDIYRFVENSNYNADYTPNLQSNHNRYEKNVDKSLKDYLSFTKSLPIYKKQQIQSIIKKSCLPTLSHDENNIQRPFQSTVIQQYLTEQKKEGYVNNSFVDNSTNEYLNHTIQNNENLICNKQDIAEVPTNYNNYHISNDNLHNYTTVSAHDKQCIKSNNETDVSIKVFQNAFKNFYKKQCDSKNDEFHTEESIRSDNAVIFESNDQEKIYNIHSNNLVEGYIKNSSEDRYNLNLCNSVDQPRTSVSKIFITTAHETIKNNDYTSPEIEYQEINDSSENSIFQSNNKKEFNCEISASLDDIKILKSEDIKQEFSINSLSTVNNSQQQKYCTEYSSGQENNSLHITHDSLVPNYIKYNPILNQVGDNNDETYTDKNNASKNLILNNSHQEVFFNDEYRDKRSTELKKKDSLFTYKSDENEENQQTQKNISDQHLISLSQKQYLIRKDSYTPDNYSETHSFQDRSPLDKKKSHDSLVYDGYSKSSHRSECYINDHKQIVFGHFTTPQPISRAESYQRGYFKDQNLNNATEIIFGNAVIGEYNLANETFERYEQEQDAIIKEATKDSLIEQHLSDSPRESIRKQNSLDESVQMDTPPRSPVHPSDNVELIEISRLSSTSTQIKERSEMTPRQKWHIAFNKIVIQLNVSKY